MRVSIKHQPLADEVIKLAVAAGMTPSTYVSHIMSNHIKQLKSQQPEVNTTS